MSLLDDARKASQTPRIACALLKLQADSPEDFELLAAAIHDRSISHAAIARVATAPPYSIPGISANLISRHRGGICIACRNEGLTW
jgi:hypothetical protein